VKALKRLLKVYTIGAAVLVAITLALGGAGVASGKLSGEQLTNAGRAALLALRSPAPPGTPAAPAAEEKRGTPASPAAGPPAAARPPQGLLREMEQAAEELRSWEDRIDLLGKELGSRLITADRKDQGLKEEVRTWNRVKKAMVPLLNRLLQGTAGWRPITEEEFLEAITGRPAAGTGAAGGDPSAPAAEPAARREIAEVLEALERREAAFQESAAALKGLAPEVLAGILAAGLRADGGGQKPAGAATAPGAALSGAEAARLLATLEPGKLARVFKALRDEDPGQAATLLSLVMQSGRGEARPGTAAQAKPVAGGAKTAGGGNGEELSGGETRG
jgi:hypothetical protein